jgi:hypothetical protein
MFKFMRVVWEDLSEGWQGARGWKRLRLVLAVLFLAFPLVLGPLALIYFCGTLMGIALATGPRFLEWTSLKGWVDDFKFHCGQWWP